MCNAWDIARERADLPPELWTYLKQEGFFGMIIPEAYGGLGFSAKAQSLVLQKLAKASVLTNKESGWLTIKLASAVAPSKSVTVTL